MKPGSLVNWSRSNSEPTLVVLLEEQIENVLWTALFPQGHIYQIIESECEVVSESR